MTAQFRSEHREKKARGLAALKQQRDERLNSLSAKALRFWERTLDDDSQATTAEKIQVSKLVVEYAWGKPKQQVQVDAKVEINHKAHVEALLTLAGAAIGPTIDHNPLIQLDNPAHGPNPPLLANTELPMDLVDNSTLDGLDGARAVGLDDPPAPVGAPGGALAHGHPDPLDIKNDE